MTSQYQNTSETNTRDAALGSVYLWAKEQVLADLKTNAEQGLTRAEALRRHERHGANVLPDHSRGFTWQTFLIYRSRDALSLFLVAALGIALAIKETPDAIMIAAVLVLDLGLSYIQGRRAEKVLARLKQHVPQFVVVIRQGKATEIPAKQLVVGDIIELNAGDRAPADARIIASRGLHLNESALTGETDEVDKTSVPMESRAPLANRRNMIYLGTWITSGSGRAVVTAISTRTEFGKIAQVLKRESSPASPWQKQLERVGLIATAFIMIAGAILLGVSAWTGTAWMLSARTAMTLIVSAIPEDLTMMLTLVLTIGMMRLFRRRGLVREMRSAETLGETTVICADKTGTLTRGEMTPIALYFSSGNVLTETNQSRHTLENLALLGLALTSDAHRQNPDEPIYIGSATEKSALIFAEKFGYRQEQLRQQWTFCDAITFNSRWKYRANLYSHPTQSSQTLFVLGAPEVLLRASSHALDHTNSATLLSSATRADMTKQFHQLAAQGKRLLAIAIRRNLHQTNITHRDITGLTFMGILVLTDPIRPHVREAIAAAQQAGLSVKIVTGDHEATASHLASQLNLQDAGNILSDLEMQSMTDSELLQAVTHTGVFSRITPLNKQRLVKALQSQGHIVAMTGDGINDAVALKSADIGIAMGSGRDIAKEAADLVLLDDDFATIIVAVKEGRVIRDNIRKVTAFLLATNAAEVAIFIVSLLLGLPLPMLPAQILWINLVTDGTADIALALEPAERQVMAQKPEKTDVNLLGRILLKHVPWTGAVVTVFASFLFWFLLQTTSDLTYIRTMLFTFMSLIALLSAVSFRSLQDSILKRGLFKNYWLIVSVAFSLGLQCLAIYAPPLRTIFNTVPLTANDWLLLTPLALLGVIIIDLRKLFLAHTHPAKAPIGQNWREVEAASE